MGETREVVVSWILPDGQGGGRVEGSGTFRAFGLVPEDRVTLDPSGAVVGVAPGPLRRPSPCPISASCGGCDLDAMLPEAREAVLGRVVQRAYGLDAPPGWVPSVRDHGHRARIKLALRSGVVGYRGARSHDVVAVEVCRVARSEVNDALRDLQAFVGRHGTHGLDEVELRSDGSRVVFAFRSVRGGGLDRASFVAAAAELGHVALDGAAVCGDPRLTLTVGGVPLRASPAAFYQVNLETNQKLVAHVLDRLGDAERVVDLYAGIGNFALPIAARGIPVVAVELEGQAVSDLRASSAGHPVEVIPKKVENFDSSRVPFDAVVLDPPRAGAPGVLPRLIENRPRRIVYVSCFAPSAARDIREIANKGYTLRDVTAFDLFPDTHHIESVAVLERRR